jgi:hypothetical protein
MLKLLFYLGLTAIGIVATLFAPIAGAISGVSAYLLNPPALSLPDGGFGYQFWTTAAFIAALAFHRRRAVPRTGHEGRILVCIWAFAAVCGLSSIWAAVSPREALNATWEITKTLIFASALIWAIESERHVSLLVTTFCCGVLHAGLLHTFGFRLGWITRSMDRDVGVLVESQSAVMLLFLPLLVMLAARASGVQRLIAAAALPFALNSAIKTYNRTAFVGMVVEGLILLLVLPRQVVLRLVPTVAVIAGLMVFRLAPENYWDWIRTVEHPQSEGSAASRFVLAETSLKILADHPFGVGYKNYQFVSPRYLGTDMLTDGKRSAHSSFFALLCETGPFGFFFWSMAFGGTLLILRRIRKGAEPAQWSRIQIYAVGFEVGLYGWLVGGLFVDLHDVDPAYWFLALAIVLYRLDQQARNQMAAEELFPVEFAGAA